MKKFEFVRTVHLDARTKIEAGSVVSENEIPPDQLASCIRVGHCAEVTADASRKVELDAPPLNVVQSPIPETTTQADESVTLPPTPSLNELSAPGGAGDEAPAADGDADDKGKKAGRKK